VTPIERSVLEREYAALGLTRPYERLRWLEEELVRERAAQNQSFFRIAQAAATQEELIRRLRKFSETVRIDVRRDLLKILDPASQGNGEEILARWRQQSDATRQEGAAS